MKGQYLGHLSSGDPLYSYLRDHIAPQMGFDSPRPEFRVHQFNNYRHVYLYEDEQGAFKVVGKFRPPDSKKNPHQARMAGETEFGNLLFLRGLGLSALPHYVVRPLGFNPILNNVLVVEYLEGETLSRIIAGAIHHGRRDRLFRKLSALAEFLSGLHNRTAGDWTVNFQESLEYLGRLIRTLIEKRGLGRVQSDEMYHLGETWRGRGFMWEDRSVIVHGDATPPNFLFGRDREVMAIDLERMKWADRVFDLGRVAGELKHYFYQATGDHLAAEPFIGHFLWEYCGRLPDQGAAFRSLTRRIPFYMGLNLLRIARNSWIDWEYRRRLIREAIQLLRVGT
ncbi:MAG: aminoglycoside phosphotransferase family protein [Thermodesulfobacteriota bacterium]